MNRYLAIDLGASGGRHIIGWLDDGVIRLEEMHRFANVPVKRGGHLCWDIEMLLGEVIRGLQKCREAGHCPVSVGVDTWGVDFALLDGEGRRLGECVCYRDSRTEGADTLTEAVISQPALYARTGMQKKIFNTIYQLAALRRDQPELLSQAGRLLLMPEYIHYLLTGVCLSEYTNASTTGLLDVFARDWDDELLQKLGFPRKLFGALHKPGHTVGPLKKDIQAQCGLDCTVVLAPSHDTASAFLAVPAADDSAVFLSSGTWSLLGVENDKPVTTPESMRAGFSNEGGFDGRFRYLTNIMGLWMLQCLRRELPAPMSFDELTALARPSGFAATVPVDDESFYAPDSMMDALRAYCAGHDLPVPQTTGDAAQCIYRSLAVCYAGAVNKLQSLTGKAYTCIHIVGGGSRDDYLNELTAKQTGLPVYAGPAEATALGNIVSQMIRDGALSNAAEARAVIRKSFPLKEYQP